MMTQIIDLINDKLLNYSILCKKRPVENTFVLFELLRPIIVYHVFIQMPILLKTLTYSSQCVISLKKGFHFDVFVVLQDFI